MTVVTSALRSDGDLLAQPLAKAVGAHEPYVVGLLLFVNIGAFVLGLVWGLPQQIRAFGFRPADPTFQTLLTSLFVHAGVWHLANNMLVLLLVGTVVEAWIGHTRIVFVYVVSGIAGTGAHTLAATNPQQFLVGASGAISGLMGIAAVKLLPSREDAAAKLLAWFVAQLILAAVFSWLGTNLLGIAVWAHIGGFVAGIILGLVPRMAGRRPGRGQHARR